jgi:hypothetical protein
VSQAIEYLHIKHNVLSSNHSTTKKARGKKKNELQECKAGSAWGSVPAGRGMDTVEVLYTMYENGSMKCTEIVLRNGLGD